VWDTYEVELAEYNKKKSEREKPKRGARLEHTELLMIRYERR
jgi:hypothetical protein